MGSPTRTESLRFEAELGAVAAALLTLAFVFARTGIPAWIPPAPMVRAGIPSPLSGMTRSFVALARGDLGASFHWHPLGPVVFAAAVVTVALSAATLVRGARFALPATILHSRAIWIVVMLVTAAAWGRQIAVL